MFVGPVGVLISEYPILLRKIQTLTILYLSIRSSQNHSSWVYAVFTNRVESTSAVGIGYAESKWVVEEISC